jgi:predicted nucleic acid-binding Zn finger protein
VDIGRIKLDPEITNYRDVTGGYSFQESLDKRSQELKETVERFAVVIWPLVVKEEDFMLVDGYCRYTTLKALNVSETYAYVGSM